MKRNPYIVFLSVLIGVVVICSGADAPEAVTVIEVSQPLARAGFVGTVRESSSKLERPFREKVTEKEVNHWAELDVPPAEGEKEDAQQLAAKKKAQAEEMAKAKAYSLAGQAGEYVGWFAIVRKASWDEGQKRTELLLQHCYYDGLSDPGIQVVSIYGGGDFRALVRDKAKNIPLLSLVRVYGKVAKGKDGLAEVTAEYVRVWDWGLFTFMDYGIDKTNETWRKMRHVEGDKIYVPHPSGEYYESVLGKREKGEGGGK